MADNMRNAICAAIQTSKISTRVAAYLPILCPGVTRVIPRVNNRFKILETFPEPFSILMKYTTIVTPNISIFIYKNVYVRSYIVCFER